MRVARRVLQWFSHGQKSGAGFFSVFQVGVDETIHDDWNKRHGEEQQHVLRKKQPAGNDHRSDLQQLSADLVVVSHTRSLLRVQGVRIPMSQFLFHPCSTGGTSLNRASVANMVFDEFLLFFCWLFSEVVSELGDLKLQFLDLLLEDYPAVDHPVPQFRQDLQLPRNNCHRGAGDQHFGTA